MWPEFEIMLTGGTLRWTGEYGDTYRLAIYSRNGTLLALEGEQTGLFATVDGETRRIAIPVNAQALDAGKDTVCWSQAYPQSGLVAAGTYRRLDGQSVLMVHRFRALRDLQSPHFSWGLRMNPGAPINRYHFTQSPTQMGYSFADPRWTLWMLSTHERGRPVRRFDGCQALVAENPDPTALEFHVRMPPGFVAPSKQRYTLKAGQTAQIQAILCLRPGFYYDHVEANEEIQPLEPHRPRYSYRHYVDLAVRNFHDPRKYHAEHNGILYHTAVDGDVKRPRRQYWTEGPGWGGGFDAENAYNVILYANRLAPARSRKRYLDHARAMLDGWLANPRFRVPKGVFEKAPGDMAEAVISTGWFPDCIWTGAQADFILRLSDIYGLTGWRDCLDTAKAIAGWVLRHRHKDGSIPTLWQFPLKQYPKELPGDWRPYFSLCDRRDHRAVVRVDCQPTTACFLAVAMFHLQKVDPAGRWDRVGDQLIAWAVERLEKPLAEFGNGEFDYLVYRARSMDPTGLAYLLWGLAEANDRRPRARFIRLIRRYMNTLLAYGVTWDCRETLLRPRSKVTLDEYGADIKLAGGITHANWMPIYKRGFGGRFNLLMNRNEIADGMYHAWQATKDRRFGRWLEAFVAWQTYFQFIREVKNSPVATKGSCPQNHFWTTDFGNWNNDYAATAHKWVGTYLRLMEAGLTGETRKERSR